MNFEQLYNDEREAHRKTRIKLRKKEHELHAITSSNSYKIAKVMAKSKHALVMARNYYSTFSPKRNVMLARNKRYVNRFYESKGFANNFPDKTRAKAAVIIHLYYTDMAPYFARKLQGLSEAVEYDLYVTVPDTKVDQLTFVAGSLPGAHIAVVPNCGRDVLPFIQVMKYLESLGYDKILKLHSKKSPHREDGPEWRDRIIEGLIPKDSEALRKVIAVLERHDTALIGPKTEYVSLVVNFFATAHYVKKIVTKLVDKKTADEVMHNPEDYGFFGGTMFWARIDAIRPIIADIDSHDFEPELGQEDSTLAHAMERLLNLIPELENKKMYELAAEGPAEITYSSTNIPEWSEMAID